MKEEWKKAIENYFYHYTIHTIVGIIAVFFIVSISVTVFQGQKERIAEKNRPPADVEVLLYGDFKVDYEKSILEENFGELFPDWDVRLTTEYVPSSTNALEDIGAQQKGMLTMSVENPDVYIFDPHQFKIYVEGNTFVSFDESFTESIPDELLISYQTETDTTEQIYAVNITDSPIFELKEVLQSERWIVIRTGSENEENAYKFIQGIVETIEVE